MLLDENIRLENGVKLQQGNHVALVDEENIRLENGVKLQLDINAYALSGRKYQTGKWSQAATGVLPSASVPKKISDWKMESSCNYRQTHAIASYENIRLENGVKLQQSTASCKADGGKYQTGKWSQAATVYSVTALLWRKISDWKMESSCNLRYRFKILCSENIRLENGVKLQQRQIARSRTR